jgi:molybdopterin-containing oxidoreductase family membrane subunit
LLIIFCFVLRKFTKFDVGKTAIDKLGEIVAYAMTINVFLVLMELFTTYYSGISEHVTHFNYLFFGIGEFNNLVPWMWISIVLAVVSLVMILVPKIRRNDSLLLLASIAIFLSIWIDKGLGMVVTGFVPTPLGTITEYWPTLPELMISIGVYAVGFLIITLLYKVALSVRGEVTT